MKLSEQQQIFTYNSALLVLWAHGQGWGLTYGEAYRPLEQAKLNAVKGIGISNTLHGKRLAIDWMLFIDDVYRDDLKAYAPLGAHWKILHPLNRWGGDFLDGKGTPKPDADHFSMEYQGVK